MVAALLPPSPVSAGLAPPIHAFERPKQRRGCADQVRARRLRVSWQEKLPPTTLRLRGSPVPPVILAVRNDIQTARHPDRHVKEGDRFGEVENILVTEAHPAQ